MSRLQEESYKCISSLREEGQYFENWLSLRNTYQPILDQGILRQNDAFTPHNYKNHSMNIYNIISSLLLRDVTSLNTEELFILDVAVLLHDIYMTYDPGRRHTHSDDAQKFVLKEQKEKDLPFTREQAFCIGDVIYGHSDIKDCDEKVLVKTIESLPEPDAFPVGSSGKVINVRILSAILRLADELDINSTRIHGFTPENYNINKESWSHWRKCQIFRFPRLSSDRSTIDLIVDDNEVQTGANEEADVKLIIEVKRKIQRELEYLNRTVLQSKEGLTGWSFNKIALKASDAIIEQVEKILKKQDDLLIPLSIQIEVQTDPLSSTDPTPPPEKKKISIDDNVFEKKLDSWVISNNLLKTGHFVIEENVYARDWIDTQTLLENYEYLRDITKQFVARVPDGCTIIGVGQQGTILAASIGLNKKAPFTYLVPDRFKQFHVDPDKAIKIDPDSKIVLVTDVVVRGVTLRKALTEMEKAGVFLENVVGVLTVFVRDPLFAVEKSEDLESLGIFALSNSFAIEICRKPNCCTCIFRENNIHLYPNLPIEPVVLRRRDESN